VWSWRSSSKRSGVLTVRPILRSVPSVAKPLKYGLTYASWRRSRIRIPRVTGDEEIVYLIFPSTNFTCS
jgi:CO dehydrogenase/acetyl-CoA synthase delta subunit